MSVAWRPPERYMSCLGELYVGWAEAQAACERSSPKSAVPGAAAGGIDVLGPD